MEDLKYFIRDSVFFFFFFFFFFFVKHKIELLFLMKYIYKLSRKNIYRKDPKFSDRSSAQTVQTEISLLRSGSTQLPFRLYILVD